MAGSQAWCLQAPKATLRAREAAREAREAELRARMRAEVALASQAADVRQPRALARPLCPHGGSPVAPRGPRERQVTTPQGHTLRRRRRDGRCPACQAGFCPPG